MAGSHSDVASVHQQLMQKFNRPASIALPRFCIIRTKVWTVRKSEVGGYNCSLASRDQVTRWLCVHGALACCTL